MQTTNRQVRYQQQQEWKSLQNQPSPCTGKQPASLIRQPELLQLYALGPYSLRPPRSRQRRRPLVGFHCRQRDLYHPAAPKTHWCKQAQEHDLRCVQKTGGSCLFRRVMKQATVPVTEGRRTGLSTNTQGTTVRMEGTQRVMSPRNHANFGMTTEIDGLAVGTPLRPQPYLGHPTILRGEGYPLKGW